MLTRPFESAVYKPKGKEVSPEAKTKEGKIMKNYSHYQIRRGVMIMALVYLVMLAFRVMM